MVRASPITTNRTMRKRYNLSEFARVYGQKYEGSAEYICYQVFEYWAICGYEDLQASAKELTTKARIELLAYICQTFIGDYVEGARYARKISIAILNTI